jgi:tyrosyl-tRNA synthetase
VRVCSDGEIGGSDQTFNLLVGRELQKGAAQAPQAVLTLPLLEGTDGVQKMSKSYQNTIDLDDTPREMFGKVMSIPDKLLETYWRYTTDLNREEIQKRVAVLRASGVNPRDSKADLGELLVALYHGGEAGAAARREFDQVFRGKGLPEDIEEIRVKLPAYGIVDLLKEAGLAASKSEARRFVEQGGVRLDGEKVTDPELRVDCSQSVLIQFGKRKFARAVYAG